MLPDYGDIRSLTALEPLWYTDQGVPRYAPFAPNLLGIYDAFAVLVEIECQECRQRLLVGRGKPRYSVSWPGPGGVITDYTWTLRALAEDFVFGDPPRHACPGAGETMSSNERRVLEAWEKIDMEWTRVPKWEIRFDD